MYELLPSWLVLCTSVSFVGSILAIMAFVRPDISSDNGPIPCWLPADTANKYFVSGLRESTVTDWTYCGTWIILVSPPEREKKISNRNELQQLKNHHDVSEVPSPPSVSCRHCVRTLLKWQYRVMNKHICPGSVSLEIQTPLQAFCIRNCESGKGMLSQAGLGRRTCRMHCN